MGPKYRRFKCGLCDKTFHYPEREYCPECLKAVKRAKEMADILNPPTPPPTPPLPWHRYVEWKRIRQKLQAVNASKPFSR